MERRVYNRRQRKRKRQGLEKEKRNREEGGYHDPCLAGCHFDRQTGVMWHTPGCPHLEDLGRFDKAKP